jgi:hypothetical protein
MRAQAFEGLFTLVPILLFMVISIILRARAARKKKQREEETRSTPVQAPQRTARQKRAAGTTRAVPFPWQRETQGVYPRRSERTPSSTAPRVPPQPSRAQVTSRESYVYPQPLVLNEAELPKDTETWPGGPAIPRPVVRPSVESRMAVERMAVPKEATNLRERMTARRKADRPAAQVADGARSSITTRLKRLPPLKRAVLWAEILAPPGGRE